MSTSQRKLEALEKKLLGKQFNSFPLPSSSTQFSLDKYFIHKVSFSAYNYFD